MGFVYPWLFSSRNARVEDEMAIEKEKNRDVGR